MGGGCGGSRLEVGVEEGVWISTTNKKGQKMMGIC